VLELLGAEQAGAQQLVAIHGTLAVHPAVQQSRERRRRQLGERDLPAYFGDFLRGADHVLDEAITDEAE
jgi:hypothetical protein